MHRYTMTSSTLPGVGESLHDDSLFSVFAAKVAIATGSVGAHLYARTSDGMPAPAHDHLSLSNCAARPARSDDEVISKYFPSTIVKRASFMMKTFLVHRIS
jgi:hypothetical protein